VTEIGFAKRMSFEEYRELIIKAPYIKHKSICECILIKLDYAYHKNTDSWTSQDNKISLEFDFSGPLTVNVFYPLGSTTQICDSVRKPLEFLSQFIKLVNNQVEVKAEIV
jgi:hypothetical protein